MKRIYNFGAGPAILPVPVLEEASKGVLEIANSGMSILEVSHRSKDYEAIHFDARDRFLKLMGLNANDYTVLFLGGGASLQFAMIPANFLAKDQTADYVNTGEWAVRAIKEAKKYGNPNVASTTEATKFDRIDKNLKLTPGAQYLHITTNNTIEGTQWAGIPDSKGVPLFADASSDIFCRTQDFSKFSLIYAGAQKNLGPSGVTVVVMKKSLLEKSYETAPIILQYKTHAKADSLYNTPPVFSIYAVGLVLKWIENQGGLAAVEKTNRKKSDAIYSAIDEFPGVYDAAVKDKADRSMMNITFRLKSEEKEKAFLAGAQALQMDGLKGHRAVGGIRASIYNAFPEEGALKLADYMRKFAKSN